MLVKFSPASRAVIYRDNRLDSPTPRKWVWKVDGKRVVVQQQRVNLFVVNDGLVAVGVLRAVVPAALA